MKRCRKVLSIILTLVVILGLLVINYTPNDAIAAETITGIDAVTVTSGGTKGDSSITAPTHSNSNSTSVTSSSVILTGSTALDDTLGQLKFNVSYTLVAGAGGTKGTAGVSASAGFTTHSITCGGINDDTKDGSATITLEDWGAGSEWTFTMSASAGYTNFFGVTWKESSVKDVTFSGFVFTPYESNTFTFCGANVPYTVNYYAAATDETTTPAVINTTETGKEIEADVLKGMSVTSNTAGYYLKSVSAVRNGSTIQLAVTDGKFYPEIGDVITPVFVADDDGIAPFLVGSTVYWTWEEAFAAAGTSGTVILNDDYTLPAGDYTIPSGVKFLVPYDSGNSSTFGTSPATLAYGSYLPGYVNTTLVGSSKGSQYPFRTLTVSADTTITCYGTINVNSKVTESTSTHSGVPVGPYGHIKLSSSTSKLILASANTSDSLTTNDAAGTMYCYGYITGDGNVEVQSGANLYEMIQALGWRGGSQVKSWYEQATADPQTITSFAFSDYAIQNVEADLLVKQGATTNVVFCIDTSLTDPKFVSAAYIASGSGLLQLGSGGALLRDYDAVNNRMQYTVTGTVTLGSIDITVKFEGLEAIAAATYFGTSTLSLNTADYIFGLACNMDFVVDSGATLNVLNSFKLLPGSSLTINGSGTDIFGNDKGAGKVNLTGTLYIYDAADYLQKGFVFYHTDGKAVTSLNFGHWDSIPVPFIATTLKSSYRSAPGSEFLSEIPPLDAQTNVASAQVIVNGLLEVSGDGAIYTTTNGGTTADKVITGTGTFIHTGKTGTNNLIEIYGVWNGDSTSEGSEFWAEPAAVATSPVLGLLAGTASDPASFAAGNYYGLSSGYWYQWKVTGENITITSNHKIDDVTGVAASGGSVTFTVPAGYKATASSGNLTVADDGVTYTLSNISQDTVIATTCAHGNTTVTGKVDSTCTEAGYTGDTVCSDCGETIIPGTQISAKGHTEVTDSAVDATCTTPGKTEGKHCSVCGTVTLAQEEIPALGHTTGEAVVENEVKATCTVAGSYDEVTYCTVCSEELSRKTITVKAGHTYGEKPLLCTECGHYGCYANVRLGNNLDMLFAFPKDCLGSTDLEPENLSIFLSRNGTSLPVSYSGETTVNGVECYYVIYSGFAAKEMCESVTITVSVGGELVVEYTDSIQSYAMRMLEKATDEIAKLDKDGNLVADSESDALLLKHYTTQRTLIVDMLNYGAACQKHFTYNTGDLANALLTTTQQGYATQTDPEASDDYATDRDSNNKGYWAGSQVLADSDSQFVIGFKSLTEGMYFTYEVTNHWGTVVSKTVTYAEMTSPGKYHGLANLRIADARQEIKITVYNADKTVAATWNDSIEAYVARMSQSDDVYMALLKFADSAKTYLHAKEDTSNEEVSGT